MVPVFTAASMLFSLLLFSFTLPPGLDFHIFKLFCYASSLLSYKIFGNVRQIVSFAFLTFCSIVLRCFCFAFPLLSAIPFTCLLFLLKIVTHNNLLCHFFVLLFIGIFCPFCHVHEFFSLTPLAIRFPISLLFFILTCIGLEQSLPFIKRIKILFTKEIPVPVFICINDLSLKHSVCFVIHFHPQ